MDLIDRIRERAKELGKPLIGYPNGLPVIVYPNGRVKAVERFERDEEGRIRIPQEPNAEEPS